MTEVTGGHVPDETPEGDMPDAAPDGSDLESDPSGDQEPGQPKNREERFRKQLRAAEAERDALSDRLSRMQRAEVERIASQHLADGADFWRDGTELAHVLTDTGDIDPARVAEVATALVDSHRHWKRTAPTAGPPASSVTGDGKISEKEPASPTWTGVLQRTNRQ
jgi:hypothetical protein